MLYVGDWREFEIDTAWGAVHAMSQSDEFAVGDAVTLQFHENRLMILDAL